ncbi:MAG: hypothetical protein HY558_01420, partial [Euryarchaeota archaeon]|nr:hypothetical protein [Euryarchaeota archaeon]
CPPAAIAAVFGTSIITWDETQFPDPWNSKGRWVPNLGYAEIDGVWYEVVGAGGGHALLMDFGSLTCWEGRDGQTCCGYTAPDLRSKVGLAVTFYY